MASSHPISTLHAIIIKTSVFLATIRLAYQANIGQDLMLTAEFR
jgi:hypothetical protein